MIIWKYIRKSCTSSNIAAIIRGISKIKNCWNSKSFYIFIWNSWNLKSNWMTRSCFCANLVYIDKKITYKNLLWYHFSSFSKTEWDCVWWPIWKLFQNDCMSIKIVAVTWKILYKSGHDRNWVKGVVVWNKIYIYTLLQLSSGESVCEEHKLLKYLENTMIFWTLFNTHASYPAEQLKAVWSMWFCSSLWLAYSIRTSHDFIMTYK